MKQIEDPSAVDGPELRRDVQAENAAVAKLLMARL
jgi:hypothetical protein